MAIRDWRVEAKDWRLKIGDSRVEGGVQRLQDRPCRVEGGKKIGGDKKEENEGGSLVYALPWGVCAMDLGGKRLSHSLPTKYKAHVFPFGTKHKQMLITSLRFQEGRSSRRESNT